MAKKKKSSNRQQKKTSSKKINKMKTDPCLDDKKHLVLKMPTPQLQYGFSPTTKRLTINIDTNIDANADDINENTTSANHSSLLSSADSSSSISSSRTSKKHGTYMQNIIIVAITIFCVIALVFAYMFVVFPKNNETTSEEVNTETIEEQTIDYDNDNIVDDSDADENSIDEIIDDSSMSVDENNEQDSAEEELVESEIQPFNLTVNDFDTIQAQEGIFAFSLADTINNVAANVEMDEPYKRRIQSALSDITDSGYQVGFLFMDMDNGRGYAYNIDETIYGASSFKAPLASYILSHFADSEGIPTWDMSQIEASVIFSDNSSFEALSAKYRYMNQFLSWLTDELTIDRTDMFDLGDYAQYAVRDGAKMWTFISHYLDSGTNGAIALAEMCANTNMSFIRNGIRNYEIVEYDVDDALDDIDVNVDDAGIENDKNSGDVVVVTADDNEHGNVHDDRENENTTTKLGIDTIEMQTAEPKIGNITIYNKAGWYAGGYGEGSITDNAIIDVERGHRYLMCIMTNIPYSTWGQAQVERLAYEIFAARTFLSDMKIEKKPRERLPMIVDRYKLPPSRVGILIPQWRFVVPNIVKND